MTLASDWTPSSSVLILTHKTSTILPVPSPWGGKPEETWWLEPSPFCFWGSLRFRAACD